MAERSIAERLELQEMVDYMSCRVRAALRTIPIAEDDYNIWRWALTFEMASLLRAPFL